MVLCSRKVRLDICYVGEQSTVGWFLVSEVLGRLNSRSFKGQEVRPVPSLNFLELQLETFLVLKYYLRQYNNQATDFIVKEHRFISRGAAAQRGPWPPHSLGF